MRILRFNESSKRYPKKVNQKEFFDKKGIHKMISFTQTERTTMFNILTEKKRERIFVGLPVRNLLKYIQVKNFLK